MRGTRYDYLRWASITQGEWSLDGIETDFRELEELLNVRDYGWDEITPFQRAVYAASLNHGLPASSNINNLDEGEGVSVCPVNKRGGFRWNAAFAFLDQVRAKPNLRIIDGVEIISLGLNDRRVTAATGIRWGVPFEIEADIFVLACGAYGTPILLQRSGIGPAKDLGPANIECLVDSPGVGHNLQDHPCVILRYAATEDLISQMRAFEARSTPFEEGVIIKKRSSLAKETFDLHIFPCGGHSSINRDEWYWEFYVALLRPNSRGSILVSPGSQGVSFQISHNHFSDEGDLDASTIVEGVKLARQIASTSPLHELLIAEVEPGTRIASDLEIRNWIRHSHLHYWHPAASCRMGPNRAHGDVCSGNGQVHGVENLFVADASLMPEVTTGNTNIPTALLGWRVARHVQDLLEG